MQTATLDWPFAVESIVVLAQKLADAHGHAKTSAAHVAHVLYEMAPVRALVASELTPATISAALLVEPKASAITAMLSPELHGILFGPTPRATRSFLESYATGHASAKRVGSVYAKHAEAIAALLDHPMILATFRPAPSSARVKETMLITLGYANAARSKHAEVTPRHVFLVWMIVLDKALHKLELEGLEAEIATVTELIDRTVSRSGTLFPSAKLFGVFAEVLANGTLDTKLIPACVADDDALIAPVKAVEAAAKRLAASTDP